jgi:hypothetical protein
MAKASFCDETRCEMGRPWIRPAIAEALDLPCAQYLPCPDNTPGTVLKEGSVHAGLTRASFACVRRKAARAQQMSLTGSTSLPGARLDGPKVAALSCTSTIRFDGGLHVCVAANYLRR